MGQGSERMRRNVKAYVSLWSADLLALGRDIDLVADTADGFHIDVFDGHNARELLFGPDFVAAVRRRTELPLDVHLDVSDPDTWAQRFIDAGADCITVQAGPCRDANATLATIASAGARASLGIELHEDVAETVRRLAVDRYVLMGTRLGIKGVAPDAATADRVAQLRRLVPPTVEICVDGGIRTETVAHFAAAGANAVIPGSLVYGSPDPVDAVRKLHRLPGPTVTTVAHDRPGSAPASDTSTRAHPVAQE